MARIIFICEKTMTGSSVSVQITEHFSPQQFFYEKDKISEFIKRHGADYIIAYIRGLVPKSEEEFIGLVQETKNIPFLLIGSERTCEYYKEKTQAENIKKFFYTPIVLTSLINQLRSMVCTEEDIAKQKELKKQILVVDDDPVFLRTMMNWLKGTYHVSVVKNGADALDFMQEEIPNLILLDYEMPGLNGIQTLEKMRSMENLANVPVVFLTGVRDNSVVRNAIQLKPRGYILKDIKQAGLLAKIEYILQSEANAAAFNYLDEEL